MKWDGVKDLSDKEFRGTIEIENLSAIDFSKLPKRIGGKLIIKASFIKNFEGCPRYVGGLEVYYSEIESLKGLPSWVKEFDISNSKIEKFDDFPLSVEPEYLGSSVYYNIRFSDNTINHFTLNGLIKMQKYRGILAENKTYNYGFQPNNQRLRVQKEFEKLDKIISFLPKEREYIGKGKYSESIKYVDEIPKISKLFFK